MDALSIKLDNLRKKYIEEGKHEVALGLAIALGESEILVPRIIEAHREEAYDLGVDAGYEEGYDIGYEDGFRDGADELED